MTHHHDHQPAETRTSTVEVACQRSGPEWLDYKGDTMRRYTIADVRAWVAELDRLGAPDDLPLPSLADGLSVTLDGGT